ncbi:type II secretion system protein [Candidatus Gracilibacteria bacterium]|nr:type II secretion system protein [Candidatus Gracilibacteria bacterium]
MKKNSTGFTLIELLISITIFIMMTVMVYANYALYQNITKVKLSLKEVSQNIHKARNMAINGYDKNKVNQSVGIYFDLNDNNTIKFYSFDYDKQVNLDLEHLIEEKKLQDYVTLNKIGDKNNLMIYFSSIYGKPTLYYFDNGEKVEINDDEIKFEISFKNALYYPLKRDLKYFKNTNVVDY